MRHRLPEQPLVDQRADREADRVAHHRGQGARVRHARRARGRQRPARRAPRDARALVDRARAGGGPHVRRGGHLPHGRALHERRSHALPLAGRGRRLGEEGPARPPAPPPRAPGPRDRRERRGARRRSWRPRSRPPIDEVEELPPPARETLLDDVYAELPVEPARAARAVAESAPRLRTDRHRTRLGSETDHGQQDLRRDRHRRRAPAATPAPSASGSSSRRSSASRKTKWAACASTGAASPARPSSRRATPSRR